MTHRENLLTKAWTKAPITIGGRPVILSPVRYAVLEQWENVLFSGKDNGQSPILAMAELLMICTATRDEFRNITHLPKDERAAMVLNYMIENEDEISSAASAGIQDHMDPIKAAMVESESPGKEDQARVS